MTARHQRIKGKYDTARDSAKKMNTVDLLIAQDVIRNELIDRGYNALP